VRLVLVCFSFILHHFVMQQDVTYLMLIMMLCFVLTFFGCWMITVHDVVCVQFQKAFGKRGPKGEIKVINVHLDEVLSGIDVTKNLPNDAEPMMSHSKKRNKDMPSSQQKRKHQISFLAFKVCHCISTCVHTWCVNSWKINYLIWILNY